MIIIIFNNTLEFMVKNMYLRTFDNNDEYGNEQLMYIKDKSKIYT